MSAIKIVAGMVVAILALPVFAFWLPWAVIVLGPGLLLMGLLGGLFDKNHLAEGHL